MRSRALYMLSILLLFTLVACSSKPADTASNSANNTAASNSAGGNAMSSPAAPAAPEPQPVVVPAGTTLTVRLGQSVGSKISSPGDSFSATLASAVSVDGNPAIPAGARVVGTVVDAKPLGRFKGGAVLELRLTSITVNGTEKTIETSAIERTQKGKGKRTAVLAGGGTALGAIVGGLAGGGKGAAIGALAGGGAGAGGAAFTGNKEIVIPAESALSFRLKSSLEVIPAK
ncbi:MAG: hypothetical protein LAO30_15205 [Acidobacteriia bacterium]|nr:hypothetical protein [Terriglobia bacterium]